MNKKIITMTAVILTALSISIIFPLYNNADDVENITINQPINLSYKSKQEIYNIRKAYVAKSIFASPNYQPSEEVFGGIESNKPWISMDWCFTYNSAKPDNYILRTSGASSHSRSLINPSLPVLIEYPYSIPDVTEYKNLCTSMPQAMVPIKATYTKSKKEVEIAYKKLPDTGNDNTGYQITALNARDFGYKYMYLDKSKSTLKMSFKMNNNISTGAKEITDFIHLGESCRVAGGCNNWSISRDDLQFKPIKMQKENLAAGANKTPAPVQTKKVRSVTLGNSTASAVAQQSSSAISDNQIYIKLWKNKPSSTNALADLNVKITFQK